MEPDIESSARIAHALRRYSYLDAQQAVPGSRSGASGDERVLHDIVARRELAPVFQPVVDLRRGDIVGVEGLIRGPADSPLHSPLRLFLAAQAHGMRDEVEHLARRVTIERFRQLGLSGRLFLNVSPECLLQPPARAGRTLGYLRELGIDPTRVVIELTENQPTFDYELMREAVLHYRRMGFSIAIDDLGQGFSSLRLWSELRPEFVKIDRHFVQGVDGDAVKREFLRSIQQIARGAGSQVIAEGIETEGEMAAVAATGIVLGQGYWLARPQEIPAAALAEPQRRAIRQRAGRQREHWFGVRELPTAADMIRDVPVVSIAATTEDVYALFESRPGMQSLPVLDGSRAAGLISRASLIDRYARPFHRELYGRRPCTVVMDPQPLLVEATTPLPQLSRLLSEADSRHLGEGFLVVRDGHYLGYGSGHDVVREMTQLQIAAARHTNPLSGLPGNTPLNERIEAYLETHETFHVCYCDLDNFKPFNDTYGYSRGDEMIRVVATTLERHCDAGRDFIGHIGGDDFMVLFGSADWEPRCQKVLADFAQATAGFFTPVDRARGGYFTENRRGERDFVPLVSLSLGVVRIESRLFSAYHQVASAAAIAKKEAKKIAGNSLFVERRGSVQHDTWRRPVVEWGADIPLCAGASESGETLS